MKTFKTALLIVGVWALLCAPGYFWPRYLDSPLGLLAAIPFLSVYLFHAVGVPGLLENSGACGWGWCSPTVFGWTFIAAFWLLVIWLVARVIVHLRGK